jgi:ABC-type amino acid transport substrate-binding protein
LPLAVAVSRGKNAELISELNETLEAMRVDGTLDEVVMRWKAPNNL